MKLTRYEYLLLNNLLQHEIEALEMTIDENEDVEYKKELKKI